MASLSSKSILQTGCCVCLSGRRWPFCTTTGRCWRTITSAPPTGWWQRRTWTSWSTWTRTTGGSPRPDQLIRLRAERAEHHWPWWLISDWLCVLITGRELRSLVIEMVMSTDMSCHFQQIKTMRNALTQTHGSVPQCGLWTLVFTWNTLLVKQLVANVN